MVKDFKDKVILGIVIGLLSFDYIQLVNTVSIENVYAADSKEIKDIKDKLNSLTISLKKNYLGLKNQVTWESYIREIKSMIEKLTNNNKHQGEILLKEVERCESLVIASARVNHVEKSMTPIKDGGYGNYLGIKNAEVWVQYIDLAIEQLELVDREIFLKQYNELNQRIKKTMNNIEKIQDKFNKDYDKVILMYENAVEINDINKLKDTLKEAEKLGTCYRSEELVKNIKDFIKEKENDIDKVLYVINYKQLINALLNNDYKIIKLMRDIDIEGNINISKEKSLIVTKNIYIHNLYSKEYNLNNYGKIINYGIMHFSNIIENYGEIENYNEFYNDARFENNGSITNYGYLQNDGVLKNEKNIYNLGEIYNKNIFINNGMLEDNGKIEQE